MGSSEQEETSRWNAASDLTSSSSGRDSARRFSMRGCLSWDVGFNELRLLDDGRKIIAYRERKAATLQP